MFVYARYDIDFEKYCSNEEISMTRIFFNLSILSTLFPIVRTHTIQPNYMALKCIQSIYPPIRTATLYCLAKRHFVKIRVALILICRLWIGSVFKVIKPLFLLLIKKKTAIGHNLNIYRISKMDMRILREIFD